MPFNSTDFSRAPWAAGLMTLTHEECLHVINTIENEVRPNYAPEYYDPQEPSDFWLQSEYNKIDWTKGINGDTYAVLKGYDPEVYNQGINENGIILPEVPTDETSDDPSPDNTETTEDVTDTPIEEE